MKDRLFRRAFMVVMLLIAVIATGGLMIGCAGDDGAAGAAGAAGAPGTDVTATQKAETCALCHQPNGLADIPTAHQSPVVQRTMAITGVDVSAGGVVTVTFTTNLPYSAATTTPFSTTTPWAGGTTTDLVRVSLVSLATGTDGQKTWFRNYSRQSLVKAVFTDNGGGSYTYVIPAGTSTDPNLRGVINTADATIAGRTYRVNIDWYGDATMMPGGAAFDFVPVFGAAQVVAPAGTSKRVVTTSACLKCHSYNDETRNFYRIEHENQRATIDTCNVCHNRYGSFTPTSADNYATVVAANAYSATTNTYGFTNNNSPLAFNTHRRHSQAARPTTNELREYAGAHYPQEITNCRTCHTAEAGFANATLEGDNWKTNPSRLACGGCHITVDFSLTSASTTTYSVRHTGGQQLSDSGCIGCHNAASIEAYHITEVSTVNNPAVPTGAVNFKYVISSVTVTNTTQPLIQFAVLSGVNSTPTTTVVFDLCTAGTTTVMTGFTGSPSFLVAYADGTDTSIDFNNKGRASAQPASISILNICSGTSGVMTGPDGSGNYTAQITDAAAGFPVGSKMRTIALQGYFTQVSPALARHTISAVKNVTGDTVRRTVIDPAKCASCHEIFEGHGGNRNISAESTGINVCVVCHNANLSSSGTTVNLTYEEATQNLKDMVHSIHAADVRTTPYIHYRAKGGSATKYDWSDVGFPGVISKCETCHVPGTYGAIPDGALETTDRVGSTATTPAGVTTLRNTVPNASDLVTSPFTSTCIACHDSALPTDHMTLQGGWIKGVRIP